jgi:hypothetical protein
MTDTSDNIELPPEVQARRALEDELFRLGTKRQKLTAELEANTNIIRRRLPEALERGISLEQFSGMVGVSRQTLHRWQQDPPKAG